MTVLAAGRLVQYNHIVDFYENARGTSFTTANDLDGFYKTHTLEAMKR